MALGASEDMAGDVSLLCVARSSALLLGGLFVVSPETAAGICLIPRI